VQRARIQVRFSRGRTLCTACWKATVSGQGPRRCRRHLARCRHAWACTVDRSHLTSLYVCCLRVRATARAAVLKQAVYCRCDAVRCFILMMPDFVMRMPYVILLMPALYCSFRALYCGCRADAVLADARFVLLMRQPHRASPDCMVDASPANNLIPQGLAKLLAVSTVRQLRMRAAHWQQAPLVRTAVPLRLLLHGAAGVRCFNNCVPRVASGPRASAVPHDVEANSLKSNRCSDLYSTCTRALTFEHFIFVIGSFSSWAPWPCSTSPTQVSFCPDIRSLLPVY
jgi:hypothetical protein